VDFRLQNPQQDDRLGVGSSLGQDRAGQQSQSQDHINLRIGGQPVVGSASLLGLPVGLKGLLWGDLDPVARAQKCGQFFAQGLDDQLRPVDAAVDHDANGDLTVLTVSGGLKEEEQQCPDNRQSRPATHNGSLHRAILGLEENAAIRPHNTKIAERGVLFGSIIRALEIMVASPIATALY
jgi:hypothetical protein